MPAAKEILFFGGGGYVAIQRRDRGKISSQAPEMAEVFSAQISSLGQGNNQSLLPFVIFQEIFLSFYESLQVSPKLKINMPYQTKKKKLIKTTESKKKVFTEKTHESGKNLK